MDDFGVDVRPTTNPIIRDGLVNGYMLVAITKLWHKMEDRSGNKSEQGGMTAEVPFGAETLLALPYREDVGPLPEGCMTPEQLQTAIKNFIDVSKIYIIKEEKKEDK